jgi:hypothetical protein
LGATGAGTNGVAIFPDAATGANAEDALVSNFANQGMNLQELISQWAPPTAPGNSPQATQNYTNYVANQLGVSPTTPVSTLGTGTAANASSNPLSSLLDTESAGFGALGSMLGLGSFSISWGRIAAFLIGLILIAGGLFLLKPTQEIVQSVARVP